MKYIIRFSRFIYFPKAHLFQMKVFPPKGPFYGFNAFSNSHQWSAEEEEEKQLLSSTIKKLILSQTDWNRSDFVRFNAFLSVSKILICDPENSVITLSSLISSMRLTLCPFHLSGCEFIAEQCQTHPRPRFGYNRLLALPLMSLAVRPNKRICPACWLSWFR